MIVSANGYGRGHEALADALVEELGVVEPSADVVVVDGMQSTFGSLNRRGTAAYARQIADDPAGYGRGYELSALPAPARALGQGIEGGFVGDTDVASTGQFQATAKAQAPNRGDNRQR